MKILTNEDHCIAQAGGFAPAVALRTWSQILSRASCIFLVDNQCNIGALLKGSSPASDLSSIVACVWSELSLHSVTPWFEYVPTELKVVDHMSRGSEELPISLGAKRSIALYPNVSEFDF